MAKGRPTPPTSSELLTAVTLPSGTRIEYVVDDQHRHIGKKVNGTLVQGFLYSSQLRPAAELDGSGGVVSRFVYATKLNVLEYMIRGGATYRLLTDHLGSVRFVVDTATGAIVQRLDYDEFGQILLDTAPGFQPFGFAGGLYDPDTKLTRFGARDYDAFTGRWTTRDPIRFAGGSANLYAYVNGDPQNATDHLGLWRWPDYLSLRLNVGSPLVGWSGGVVLDRHGNLYWAPVGVTVGKSATIVSGSLTGGWLFQCGAPSESSLKDFLSGHGVNAGGGVVGGGGITWSPGNGLAGEVGLYSPQVGVSYHYSWQRGNLGTKW